MFSLSEPEMPRERLVQRFFDGVEKFTPQLVSWNGGGFDLPVLHYRACFMEFVRAALLGFGRRDYNDSRDFKWNNYIGATTPATLT